MYVSLVVIFMAILEGDMLQDGRFELKLLLTFRVPYPAAPHGVVTRLEVRRRISSSEQVRVRCCQRYNISR